MIHDRCPQLFITLTVFTSLVTQSVTGYTTANTVLYSYNQWCIISYLGENISLSAVKILVTCYIYLPLHEYCAKFFSFYDSFFFSSSNLSEIYICMNTVQKILVFIVYCIVFVKFSSSSLHCWTEISLKFDNYHPPTHPPTPGKIEMQLENDHDHVWPVGN